MASKELIEEVDAFICGEMKDAFQSIEPSRWLGCYVSGEVFKIHQITATSSSTNAEKIIKLYRGPGCTQFGKLLTGVLPAQLAAKSYFGKLRKAGYSHSHMKLLKIKVVGVLEVQALASFGRYRKDEDAPYEVMAGVYNLVKVNGKWAISELWTFEDARAPPGQVSMQGFEDVPEPDAASRPGWYDQI